MYMCIYIYICVASTQHIFHFSTYIYIYICIGIRMYKKIRDFDRTHTDLGSAGRSEAMERFRERGQHTASCARMERLSLGWRWDQEQAQNAGYMILLKTLPQGTLYSTYNEEQECIIHITATRSRSMNHDQQCPPIVLL